MLIFEFSSETRVFRHLSNHVFEVRNCRNTKTYEGHLFFQNVQNLRYISKMQPKIEKKVFVSEIIGSELVSLIVSMKSKILFIGSQCVNKQSQDFACQ